MKSINKKRFAAVVALAAAGSTMFAAGDAAAILPSYVTGAITDSQAQLTDLVSTMVPAAITLVLLALTPRVLLKMIRGLGSKVSF
jgi:hypothetical protein